MRIAESSLFAEKKEADWDRDVTNVLYVVRLHFPSEPTVRLSDSGLRRPRIPDNLRGIRVHSVTLCSGAILVPLALRVRRD